MPFYYYFDPTYILVLAGVLLCMTASAKLNATYNKYQRVRSYSGMTGAEAAQRILYQSGIRDVRIEHVSGNLTDHYDPRNKVLRLSDTTYGAASVAAVGVAAHECGHAMQHAHGYVPLSLRSALVPVANFGSAIAWPLILFGLLMGSRSSGILITVGILAFSAAVLFQIVTLPVEFNASGRALRVLEDNGILQSEEIRMTRKVLSAAALTYVAGAASAILQLLRLLLLTNRRRD